MATMKAITIMQPFADLIASGMKRVENRPWRTHYRGPIAIHAGLSRTWLRESDDDEELVFGAVIATCELVDCLSIDEARNVPWLRRHPHTQGPWCLVLADVQRLDSPIFVRGRQSLWDWEPPARLVLRSGEG